MPYSLAIFDLDGTLVDSFPWFGRTINHVADRFGFLRVTEEEIDTLRAASTREILTALQLPLWKVPAVARYMRRLKAEAAAETPLFPGVPEMLQTLADAGVKLALVTSDGEANARRKLGSAAALISLRLTVLHRQECELCDQMIAELQTLGRTFKLPPIDIVDVDSDPELTRRYGLNVPVLLLDGTVVCRHRLDSGELKRVLRPRGQ